MFEAACMIFCKEKTVDGMMSIYNIIEEEAVALVEACE
jgi:hypothetical protein